VTQKQIVREVWPGSHADASLALRVHVNHLRSKLGVAVSIKNEPGLGIAWRWVCSLGFSSPVSGGGLNEGDSRGR